MKLKLREKKVNVFGRAIPLIAVVAVVFIIVGIAGAALVTTLSTTMTILEPITVEKTDFPAEGFPGYTEAVVLTIDNAADREYGLIVTSTVEYPDPNNVTVSVGDPDDAVITDAVEIGDNNYNIAASGADGTLTYAVEILAGADSGTLIVSFDVERVGTLAPV